MILALETSTPHGSLAVWDTATGAIMAEERFKSDRAHNAMIFEPLHRILEALTGPLEWIVVGTGPGSYSGVRVGIAVANALSLAREASDFGLPSIAALEVAPQDYLVVGDARRHSFYLARVRDRRLEAEPELLDAEGLHETVREAADKGEAVFTGDSISPLGLESIQLAAPSASRLARLAAGLPDPERELLAARPIEPLYIREPYITTPRRP